MEHRVDVAIVGATGLVGEALVAQLEERRFPLGELHLLAAEDDLGKRIEFRGGYLQVSGLGEFDFGQVQLALFAVPPGVAAEFVPRAVAAGCTVVDTSGAFGAEPDVPLVAAALNPQAVADVRERGIVATPGPAALQLLTVLEPIRAAVGLERVAVTALLPVSMRGSAGVEELAAQAAALLNGLPIESRVFPAQIAFNALPDVEARPSSGYTHWEAMLVGEVQRIWGTATLPIEASAVYLSTFHGCLQQLRIRPGRQLSRESAQRLLAAAPGLRLLDGTDGAVVSPIDAVGQDRVLVGRLRESQIEPGVLELWTAADNVRLGVANNAIQVAELLVKEYL